MKTILNFFKSLFAGFLYNLYELAEAKFTLHVATSLPIYNYFDQGNYSPAPYGVSVPFNQEQNDIWMSYDSSTSVGPFGAINIWNYNRTVVIVTYPMSAPAFSPAYAAPVFFDETQSTPVTQGTASNFNKENNYWIAYYTDGRSANYLSIWNFSRKTEIGSYALQVVPVIAKNLIFIDNSNVTPVPQGINAPFNNEPIDLWIGYDVTTKYICVTNYNRTVTIACMALIN